ncbi:hypothetical protein MTBUT4_270035 [Magnetospirillum sp. UT-4]|nr:hypothetical protein MTBUT4_270035 [Magnetospirillum sp. UT-4]
MSTESYDNGCPQEKDLQVPSQYAPRPSCAAEGDRDGVPELRRAEAAPPCVRGMRPLRRPRSGGSGRGERLGWRRA